VESADDISKRSINAIEGLKQPEVDSLITWRKSLIRDFKVQPKPKVGLEDLKSIEAGILNTKIRLQRELKSAPAHLQQLKQRIIDLSSSLRPEANSALAELAQIDRDLRKCSPRAWIATAMIVYFCTVGFIAVLKSGTHLSTSTNTKEPRHAIAPPERLKMPEPPTIPNPPEDKNARALFDRGLKMAKEGNTLGAIALYKQALSIDPSLKGGSRELGAAYLKIRNYQNARDAYSAAIANDSRDAAASAGLGQSLMGLHKFSEAAAVFKQATQLQPKEAKNFYNLGLAYKGMRDYSNAVASFKQAYTLQPSDANSHYEAGLAYLKLGNRGLATSEFIELNSLNETLASQLYKEIQKTMTQKSGTSND